jgi:AraC family transcriptional regulator
MPQSPALDLIQLDTFEPPPNQLVSNLRALIEVAQAEFERDREIAKASIARASAILRLEMQRRAASGFPGGSGELAGWQVQRLRAYIDDHLCEKIQVKDLSLVARRSTAHFCRAFKRTFGQTPHAYVTAQRVELAKRLMLESSEQLSIIALLCGFTDQAHLSKLFRRSTGETPGAWRRRRRQEDQAPAPPRPAETAAPYKTLAIARA